MARSSIIFKTSRISATKVPKTIKITSSERNWSSVRTEITIATGSSYGAVIPRDDVVELIQTHANTMVCKIILFGVQNSTANYRRTGSHCYPARTPDWMT